MCDLPRSRLILAFLLTLTWGIVVVDLIDRNVFQTVRRSSFSSPTTIFKLEQSMEESKQVRRDVISGNTTDAFITSTPTVTTAWPSQHESLQEAISDKTGKLREYFKIMMNDDTEPEVQVIVLTYMRSGSTFTGDVLQNDPEVFYVFEPLFTITRLIRLDKGGFAVQFLNKQSRPVRVDRSITQTHFAHYMGSRGRENAQTITDMLRCRFADVDTATLHQRFFSNSLTTRNYSACVKTKEGILGVLECLPMLVKACRSHPVSVVKTIRLPVETVEYHMKKNPKLRILHLVRDPRPTLLSQGKFGRYRMSEVGSYASDFCGRVHDDLEATQRLMKLFPNRVAVILYEDLALEPLKKAEAMYRFLSMNFTSRTRDFVKNLTGSGSERKRCFMCTKKANSTATALEWRKTIPMILASSVDRNCLSVYEKLGFLPFETEARLRNVNVSLRGSPQIPVL